MSDYISRHTGEEIDDAVDAVQEGLLLEVINGLDSTDADKPLSAAQGYVLKRELIRLFNALSNSAFSTARPIPSWSAPVTYGYSQNLIHCTSDHSGSTVDGSGGVVTIVITPDQGYILHKSAVTVSVAGGGTASISRNAENGKVTVTIATVTGSVTINANAKVPAQFEVSQSLLGITSSYTSEWVTEGSTFEAELSAQSGYSMNGVVPSVLMGGDPVSGTWDSRMRKIKIEDVTGNISISATAEQTNNPSVTYKLSGCDEPVDAPQEVGYGDDLTVVLTKNSSFHGISHDPSGQTKVGFLPRDIIVFMGGLPLEQGIGKDFTAEADASGDSITVTIHNVTANVLIMNVQWVNGSIGSDGGVSDAFHSVYTEDYVPIPTGCQSIAVMHNFVGTGVDTNVAKAFAAIYNSDKTRYVSQQYKGRRVLRFPPSGAQYSLGDYSFIRFSALQWGTITIDEGDQVWGTGGSYNGIDYSYLYDETHEKFIWKGRYVTALVTTPE